MNGVAALQIVACEILIARFTRPMMGTLKLALSGLSGIQPPMLRWYSFLLTVLLILSLPLRPAGAVPLPLGAAPTVPIVDVVTRMHRLEIPLGNTAQQHAVASLNMGCHHVGDAPIHAPHAVGSCGACVLCVAGAVAAGQSALPGSVNVTTIHTARPASDPAESFLTEGIDRPPRSFLA
ncbi:TPA: hypothetical protein ACU967_005930 [Burkholderia contaminans]|uniref:hypothetical protein n=1 Tax=Burkholderia cepacia complex TaxID=87882 RepID=UPI000AA9C665|nr:MULTISPECIES: hypothetical protein [Burkholderia cepacia complex]MBM6430546.1 hypothetical protein [Burkholderia contaminans]MCA7880872.1 hypothetical protein [Burkholderia contaminans]MDN8025804.1 hypothetical protein [Burkholderia contaminans]